MARGKYVVLFDSLDMVNTVITALETRLREKVEFYEWRKEVIENGSAVNYPAEGARLEKEINLLREACSRVKEADLAFDDRPIMLDDAEEEVPIKIL